MFTKTSKEINIGHSWQAGQCINAMAPHAGENQISGPAFCAKACFRVIGNVTPTNNMQQGWVNKQSMYMTCRWVYFIRYRINCKSFKQL